MALGYGCSCGEYVIHNQYVPGRKAACLSHSCAGFPDPEGPPYVAGPLVRVKRGLRAGFPDSLKQPLLQSGSGETAADFTRDDLCLIVPPFPEASPVQRYRNYQVNIFEQRRRGKFIPENAGKAPPFA